MIEDTWKSLATVDSNRMINLKKKLQALKIVIRQWTKNTKKCSYKAKISIQSRLSDIDKILNQGAAQKFKVRWAIEGDENTKFFHCILNSKRSQLAIRGTFVDGLISDVQSAFVSNSQILDGPFIFNELLLCCKHKKFKAMVFKVDFKKAFDAIRGDAEEEQLNFLLSHMDSLILTNIPDRWVWLLEATAAGIDLGRCSFCEVVVNLTLHESVAF
nr:RNA-directed DNA polymerase, eukaryota [Tanacetum cinerariifolium]